MDKIGTYRYQVIFLGDVRYREEVQKILDEKLKDDERTLIVCCASEDVDFRLPAAGIYFGKRGCNDNDIENVFWLLEKGVHILPVTEDLEAFSEAIPYLLSPVNAAEVKRKEDCIKIVNYLLAEFRLLREKKKVFISYCRKDTSRFAYQLYDELNHRGYDVFLDSYSIDYGLDFQEELQEFLADSDIMVFLRSEQSAKSRWVQAELAKVNRLQIGVVEVQWPELDRTNGRQHMALTYPMSLGKQDVRCPYLLTDACHRVADAVDRWRARSMQARTANLKLPLLDYWNPYSVILCPSSVVASEKDDGMQISIPVVGLPCAMDYDKANRWIGKQFGKEQRKVTDVQIVYDSLYLKRENIAHLKWLDRYLPVKSMDIRKLIMKNAIMKKNNLRTVFLSASIPSPERDPEYYRTADIIAIRDAIRALAASVLPYVHLIWGGHPSITPLIREVLERVGITREEIKDHVTLYQSRFFEGVFPTDNEYMETIQLTDIQYINGEKDRNASLDEMRCQMLAASHSYVAGIFIGGMEGVEEECRLFREYHPDALLLPIASTGAAALHLMENQINVKIPENFDCQRLRTDFDYQMLFENLFKDIIEEFRLSCTK